MKDADFKEVFRYLAVLISCCIGVAFASDSADPPGRVGALSYFEGAVESWSATDNDWIPATLNLPLTSGSALATPPDSRAEVRIGSTTVRLAGASEAVFTQIDDAAVAVELADGAVRARMGSLGRDDSFALTTAGMRFEARDASDYRLDLDDSRQHVTLSVFAGRVQVLGADENIVLTTGQQTEIDLAAQRVLTLTSLTHDPFDDWFEARERSIDSAETWRHVSPEMTGADLLEGNGYWSNDATYGAIWFPTIMVAGWAPYRYGNWTWMSPWGWTWVDSAPWGFAPFHYGRWVMLGGRWGWVPGRRIARPVYAPALVGFHDGGPNVGWFPLGPGETYRPMYRAGSGYASRLNQDLPATGRPATLNTYRYAQEPDAVTTVPHSAFAARRPIPAAALPSSRAELKNLPIATRPVVPAPFVRTNPSSTDKQISSGPTPNSTPSPAQGMQSVMPPAQVTAPERRDANRPGFIPPPVRAQNPSGMTPYRQPQPAADVPQRLPGAITPPSRAPEATPQLRPNWRSQQAPVPQQRPAGGYERAPAPAPQIAPAAPPPSRSMEAPRAPRQEIRAPSRNESGARDWGAGRAGGGRGME
ncbi:MAG: FecR domain-containing protein [Betaproteobacteria bacterium]|nr:FecR domain-containing protein [Betaproteobacteria bacterium]